MIGASAYAERGCRDDETSIRSGSGSRGGAELPPRGSHPHGDPLGDRALPRAALFARQARLGRGVIAPSAVDNEEEGYGRNAGSRRHYFRVAFPMTEIWPGYAGPPKDGLRIEVFEGWLERIRAMTRQDHDHGHAHAHLHAEIGQSGRPGDYAIMETAVEELLFASGLIGRDEIRRQIEVLGSRRPALGSGMVGQLSYYERWIVAFANILFGKGILTPAALAPKMAEVEARWTEHEGAPAENSS